MVPADLDPAIINIKGENNRIPFGREQNVITSSITVLPIICVGAGMSC